jgi:CRP-like cAMP-binding protein
MTLFSGEDKMGLDYESYGTVHHLNPGEVIMDNHERPAGNQIGILIEGYAKMNMFHENGKEIVAGFLKPISSFGEIKFFTNRDTSHNILIVAVTPVKFISVTKNELLSLINAKPELALFLLKSSVEKLDTLFARLYGESFQNSLAVISELLLAFSSINMEINMSHQEISEAVGRNRVTVSRALLQLQKSGAIEQSRKKILIKDIDLLVSTSKGN